MNQAYLAARRAGRGATPMLTLDLRGSHDYDLGTRRYGPRSLALPDGGAIGLVPTGGFGNIRYGPGIKENSLRAVTTTVRVADADRSLVKLLESYDPRGSASTIHWVVPELVASDWELLFKGVLFDWKVAGSFVDLLLRTDDSVLASGCPRPTFNKSEWSTAIDGSIYNTAMPLLMGYFSNFAITARGMVPAINIRYDDLQGLWWIASLGNVQVDRLYIDAVEIGGWSVRRGVYGGAAMTIIVVDPASKPEQNAVLTFDGNGPDVNGLLTGPVMSNPVRQLRTFLEQYVYRNAPASPWDTTPLDIIDAASWDAVEDYLDLYEYESSVRIGGDRDKPTAMEVVQSFLDSYSWMRLAWLPNGSLAAGIVDHRDADPSSDWTRVDVTTAPAEFLYEPGDRREVFSHVQQPYMWSPAEQKFMAAIEAHDIASAREPVWATVSNRWSQGRFTQS